MKYAINELEKALEHIKKQHPKDRISLWGKEGCVYKGSVGEIKRELIQATKLLKERVA